MYGSKIDTTNCCTALAHIQPTHYVEFMSDKMHFYARLNCWHVNYSRKIIHKKIDLFTFVPNKIRTTQ